MKFNKYGIAIPIKTSLRQMLFTGELRLARMASEELYAFQQHINHIQMTEEVKTQLNFSERNRKF